MKQTFQFTEHGYKDLTEYILKIKNPSFSNEEIIKTTIENCLTSLKLNNTLKVTDLKRDKWPNGLIIMDFSLESKVGINNDEFIESLKYFNLDYLESIKKEEINNDIESNIKATKNSELNAVIIVNKINSLIENIDSKNFEVYYGATRSDENTAFLRHSLPENWFYFKTSKRKSLNFADLYIVELMNYCKRKGFTEIEPIRDKVYDNFYFFIKEIK